MEKWRKRYWTRSHYPLKQNSESRGNKYKKKKEKRTFMHGQLHFRTANSDLRGSAGVLRLLLFNSGEGSPVNFQRISHDVSKKEKKSCIYVGNKYYKSVYIRIKLLNLGRKNTLR